MTAPVITVTLNPAIDQTISLAALRPGEVHRATAVAFNAGGKGVNVASCLADWDAGPVTATGILGRGNAHVFESLFAAKHITDEFIRVPGETRTNIKLAHDDDTTDVNLPGIAISADAIAALRKTILDLSVSGALVLLAGSLPDGIAPGIYADLTAAIKTRGARVLLDTSGAPLNAALTADVLPYCIKPNRTELETFTGRALPTHEDLIGVGKTLRARGVELVVISLGAEGSLFIGNKILHARLPAIRAASTVGAGDAMVAGIIAALCENTDLETIARTATAFAVGKLGQPGPNLPPRATIEALKTNVEITVWEGEKT